MHVNEDIFTGKRTLIITKQDKNKLDNAKLIIKGLAKFYPEWEPVWKAMKEGKLAIPSPKKTEEGEESKSPGGTTNKTNK